ncbi:gliding motility-associated C-terminal domain-containing protein [Microvirga sp. STR05]|uniref:Gliding motility-associated C-terminal domain-containing protein n=1 Tax=Hymenobacter duratus TaxID=2771356 RepID=A0ABR8JH94_9BACT|nr:gliding motility-associated C-terminal domain-containing protein [Hymenobacter duratus]MBD2714976.1 gliding motility-associated C-terminal domain-containing protein [Hymenobacter duratus]MBR7949882.1 gliding motility-associated C-terminal domain-containing protein [Microvirga sp. STR05]
MRSANYFYLLLLFVGIVLAAHSPTLAQPCAATPGQPACTFVAVDVQTNQIVEKLCVGRPVRFDLCSGRQPLVYTYQVLPGSAAYPNPCGPGFQSLPYTYTPTATGPITVTENGQPGNPGGTSTIYFREFQVYDNPAPAFTTTSCSPGFVQVTLPGAPYDSYTVQIGSSVLPAPRGQTITYPVPAGATSITVAGVYSDNALCTRSATQTLPQLAAPGPLAIQNITLQGTTAQLTVAPLTAGYRYSVERADFASPTAFQTVTAATPTGLTGFTIPGAAPGFYRIRRADDCQQALAVSDPISTLTLTVQAAERRNELAWQLGPDPASFELTRTPALPPGVVLSPAARTYTDTAVACGITYTYRLTARYQGSVSSVSNEVAVRATATQAPPVPQLLATFDERNRVVLTASVARFPTTGQLTYLRDGTPIGSTPARTRRDSLQAYSPAAAPCYQVRFEDDCSNRSPDSAPFCPAVLAAELADPRGSSVRLQWSKLRGAPAATTPDTLRYRLLVLNPDNTVRNTLAVSSRGTYLDLLPPTDLQAVRYRLEVMGGGLPAPSYSNIASVVRRLEAYVPTAFTPNGDGLNDVLEVKGRFLKTYTFTVVDRNGQEVFRGTDRTQAWDGRIRNEKPVQGAYVWRFEARDDAGQTVVQHGTVTILQ